MVIEAVQYDGNFRCLEVFPLSGVGGFKPKGDDIIIPTLEGEMLAKKGDWIVKGVNGEFYPVKDDIFQKTYESI